MVVTKGAPLQDCSRILRDEWNTKQYRRHRKKMLGVKSTIDNKAPNSKRSKLASNPRGKRLKAERQCEIYRENCLLIRNLMKIQKDKNDPSRRKKALGRPGFVSRNAINQRKEMEKIVVENKVIVIFESQRPFDN
jgi:hypothetical protein